MWLYILLLWIFFIGAGILLSANLPADISDRRKLQIMEFLLRITNEYLGELIENIFGTNVRNSVLRFWMGLGFVIPLPQPKNIKVDDKIMGGVRVRCYHPKKLRSRGALIYIHGGGWATMQADYYDSLMYIFAKRVGVKVFSVDYRLAPEHPYPAAVDDCLTVAEHLHAKANDYDIDDKKIAVCGDSAGGNLSAVVAQKLKDKKCICCQVLIYPVTSVFSFNLPSYQEYYKKFKDTALLNPKAMARWILMYLGLPSHIANVKKLMKNRHVSKELRGTAHFERYLEADILKKTHGEEDFGKMDDVDSDLASKFKRGIDPSISPIFGISSDLPPALVLTCGYDVLRDEGKIYAKALQEANVKTSHLHYPTAFHGILNMPRSAVCNQMTTSIVSYLEKHLVQ